MSSAPRVVVFLGPSLPRAEAAELLSDAELRPPAERGDVLRAALAGFRVICLIDGYFEHRLAVQHKELLWALKQGRSVYGAASMGALRAAELEEYGVVGVGDVYRSYADGSLENDDEVAVTHGPAPEYRAGSEPLVDIRATLRRAVAERCVADDVADALVALVRQQFYPERSYTSMLARARAAGIDPGACERLKAWLREPRHRVKQKRNDAIELLALVRRALDDGALPTARGNWDLPWTSAWGQLWSEVTRRPAVG